MLSTQLRAVIMPRNAQFLDQATRVGQHVLPPEVEDRCEQITLQDDLRRFIALDTRVQSTRLARSILLGTLGVQLALLIFLADVNPQLFASVFSLSLISLPILLVLGTIAFGLHMRFDIRRNALARQFFELGLRVDERYRLLTNVAHPSVIASP